MVSFPMAPVRTLLSGPHGDLDMPLTRGDGNTTVVGSLKLQFIKTLLHHFALEHHLVEMLKVDTDKNFSGCQSQYRHSPNVRHAVS